MKAGEIIDERFVIDRLASSGGMGAVYRAKDRTNDTWVALKVLHDPSEVAAERFGREADVLAALDHPNIVRYIARGSGEEGMSYLAIEWLEGEDLADFLDRGTIDVADAVDLVKRVALALGAAHERGVVHRDVKPSNLFLEGGDLKRVKVLDFGVARLTGDTAHTRTGTALGTPAYMAPEQARGEKQVDARVDVFALGCVLFECIAGRPVFVAEHVMAILAKVLLEEAPRLSEVVHVPAAVDGLVARMLSKKPEGRPLDGHAVAALLEELEAHLEDPPASTLPPPPSLTTGEQRLLSVVLAAHASARDEDDDQAKTLEPVEENATVRLRVELATHGAHVEKLADGSMVATLSGDGSANDQAARAARFALALRAMQPQIAMALATGRATVTGDNFPVGEVIDRAAGMLRRDPKPARAAPPTSAKIAPSGSRPLRLGMGSAPAAMVMALGTSLGGGMMLGASGGGGPRPVRVDDVTAGLLDVRFDVSGDAGGLVLIAEREQIEATRTLLGKPTPFVGRDRELSVLTGLFEECVKEQVSRAVLITAPAGVGKSRLRQELVQILEDSAREGGGRLELWVGRGDPMSAGAPYAVLAPALRRAAGIYDGEPAGVRRQKLRARVGRSIPAVDLERVCEFLGELMGVPFPDEDSPQLRAARLDPLLMTDQVRGAWEAFVAAEAQTQPVVLVVEDMHWGDEPSILAIDGALRSLEAPFFVVALGRPEVRERFPRLWEGRSVYELRLSELTKKAADRLVRAVLPAAADAVVARVVGQASGNAFFLEELIRAVASGREKLPETVLAMVEARLHGLDADTRRVLRAASVFGQSLWRGGVAALVGAEAKPQLLQKLDALVDLEMLSRRSESRFPGQVEYGFRQAIVREAAYAMLTPDDRRLGHELAARWLESVGEPPSVALAEHHERGGNLARAAEIYLYAAREARDANDLAAAIARAEQGVACEARGELLGELRLLQAEAHRWRDENAALVRAAAEAFENLPEDSAAWYSALAELATGHARIGQEAELAVLGERLRDVVLTEGPAYDKTRAVARVVSYLVYAGQTALATVLVRKLDDLDTGGEPELAAQVHTARAVWLLQSGDVSAALGQQMTAIALYERVGDRRNACYQRANRGAQLTDVGQLEDATVELRATRVSATELNLPFVALVSTLNLGCTLAYLGRLDEARATLADVVTRAGDLPTARVTAGARIYYAIACCLGGDFAQAEPAARAAVNTQASAAPLQAYALAALARAELGLLKRAEALEHAEAAMAILESLGSIDAGDAFVRLTHAEAVYASGDMSRAGQLIKAAQARLVGRADMILDARTRESFLRRVPENAATVARAAAWG